MKRRIRLTESMLNRVIRHTVKRVLREDQEEQNQSWQKERDYQIVGPLSYEEAGRYGDKSCPTNKFAFTQSKRVWDYYTRDNTVYV